MATLSTKYFGIIEAPEDSSLHFPLGLPAFEDQHYFFPINLPSTDPLVFLQSAGIPDLCFLAFPVLVVDRNYDLTIAPEDLAVLGLDPCRQPSIGAEVLVLSLLSVRDGFPVTANLLAPIVVNMETRQAVQAVRHDSSYSHAQLVHGFVQEQAC